MLWRYITAELDVSYRKILKINPGHNYPDEKLKWQYAAGKYIELLYKGYTIINVYQRTFYNTDPRSKGW